MGVVMQIGVMVTACAACFGLCVRAAQSVAERRGAIAAFVLALGVIVLFAISLALSFTQTLWPYFAVAFAIVPPTAYVWIAYGKSKVASRQERAAHAAKRNVVPSKASEQAKRAELAKVAAQEALDRIAAERTSAGHAHQEATLNRGAITTEEPTAVVELAAVEEPPCTVELAVTEEPASAVEPVETYEDAPLFEPEPALEPSAEASEVSVEPASAVQPTIGTTDTTDTTDQQPELIPEPSPFERFTKKAQTLDACGAHAAAATFYEQAAAQAETPKDTLQALLSQMACLVKASDRSQALVVASAIDERFETLTPAQRIKVDAVLKGGLR